MAEKLKNYFNDELVSWWSERLAAAEGFDRATFEACATELPPLEMMARVGVIAAAFEACLPSPPDSFDALLSALPAEEVSEASVMDGYRLWPVSEFLNGVLTADISRYDEAEELLIALTKRFTSEFAVRPLVDQKPAAAFKKAREWAKSDNVHVRRLASEGLRSRLPWGKRLKHLESDAAHKVIAVLALLKHDPSEYVRRSVANNLGDIAKANPEIVIDTCAKWLKEAPEDKNLRKLVEHALRHVLKKGKAEHKRAAFDALGFASPKRAGLTASAKLSANTLAIGETLEVSLSVRRASKGTPPVRVRLDFEVIYPAKSGGTRAAVFRGLEAELGPNDTAETTTKRAMKPASTRPLYPGTHRVNLLLNGERIDTELSFELG